MNGMSLPGSDQMAWLAMTAALWRGCTSQPQLAGRMTDLMVCIDARRCLNTGRRGLEGCLCWQASKFLGHLVGLGVCEVRAELQSLCLSHQSCA